MSDSHTSLSDMLAARLALLDGDHWDNMDDAQCDEHMAKLYELQEAILKQPFSDATARLGALAALLHSNDQPGFADDFKNRLFEILRSS